MERFLDFAADEMVAAEILMSSIFKMLQKGKLDTEALGELIDDELLMEINPQSTRVHSVTHKKAETKEQFDQLVFLFDAIGDVYFVDRVILGDLFIVLGLLAPFALIACALYIYQKEILNHISSKSSTVIESNRRGMAHLGERVSMSRQGSMHGSIHRGGHVIGKDILNGTTEASVGVFSGSNETQLNVVDLRGHVRDSVISSAGHESRLSGLL